MVPVARDSAAAGGVVYLVGAGPGDPKLLTLRGLEVLQQADVVVFDHLANPRLLTMAPTAAIQIAAGKSIGHNTLTQAEINDVLADHARQGRIVVRLKGGDPFVFGRGGEEAEHLRDHGIRFEVVPGVTAGLGATAYAGIPVTHRESASAVAFVTGHDDPTNAGRLDWLALARFPGTLVIYMGVTRLRQLCQTLIDGGKPPATPAALIEAGTTPRQRVVEGTLASLPDRAVSERVGFPALFVVGEVVSRRSRLDWFAALPLLGQRILVTRPAETGTESARGLEALGAEVLVAPMIVIQPTADPAHLNEVLDRLPDFDWVVFTSANGVRHLLDRLLARGEDVRRLGRSRIAAIGPATAEALAHYHLHADLVPGTHRSEDLADALRDQVRGQRVLLARADRGRSILADQLSSLAAVESVVVYENRDADAILAPILSRLEQGTIDWVTLTSPASVARFHALLTPAARDQVLASVRLASISPLTSTAITQLGWTVAAEAEVATWDGIVAAIRGRCGS